MSDYDVLTDSVKSFKTHQGLSLWFPTPLISRVDKPPRLCYKRPATNTRRHRSQGGETATPRTIRVLRSTQLTCKNWLVEAPCRMLQNNRIEAAAFRMLAVRRDVL